MLNDSFSQRRAVVDTASFLRAWADSPRIIACASVICQEFYSDESLRRSSKTLCLSETRFSRFHIGKIDRSDFANVLVYECNHNEG